MSWLWLWCVGFNLLLSCGGCVCVGGWGNVSGIICNVQGMAFEDSRLVLLQTEGN